MEKRQRKQVLIDRTVQGALLFRITTFWICCMLYILIPSWIGLLYQQPDTLFQDQFTTLWVRYAPILIAMLVLIPCAIYDLLMLTNRFVGPMYRVRRELRRLANGEAISPVKFRANDFWQDLATSINDLAGKLHATSDSAEARCDHS